MHWPCFKQSVLTGSLTRHFKLKAHLLSLEVDPTYWSSGTDNETIRHVVYDSPEIAHDRETSLGSQMANPRVYAHNQFGLAVAVKVDALSIWDVRPSRLWNYSVSHPTIHPSINPNARKQKHFFLLFIFVKKCFQDFVFFFIKNIGFWFQKLNEWIILCL